MALLDNIKIVLIETSHTGNIGSAARAMKTMGITDLCLVNPLNKPDAQSISLAAGAHDIIEKAHIVESMEAAIAQCQLVIGTSARSRHLKWPHLESYETGAKIMTEVKCGHKVALVFGRERVGLTNEELQKCHYHVSISANPEYSSLNLAMSVQVLCYEIRMVMLRLQEQQDKHVIEHDYPSTRDIERFYQHLEQSLLKTGFINANHPGNIMGRLRRLFTRARVEQQELNILRGILTSIDKQQIK